MKFRRTGTEERGQEASKDEGGTVISVTYLGRGKPEVRGSI